MAEPSAISPLLDNLTCELIGTCLDLLAEGGELWPTLAYTTANQEVTTLSFNDDTTESCLMAAKDEVRHLPDEVIAYAIAYNGSVQTEEGGEDIPALLVEFGERGAMTAYSAFIPYEQGRTEDDFISGEPMAAGEEPLLFE